MFVYLAASELIVRVPLLQFFVHASVVSYEAFFLFFFLFSSFTI